MAQEGGALAPVRRRQHSEDARPADRSEALRTGEMRAVGRGSDGGEGHGREGGRDPEEGRHSEEGSGREGTGTRGVGGLGPGTGGKSWKACG